jgi:rare lipoprotein A
MPVVSLGRTQWATVVAMAALALGGCVPPVLEAPTPATPQPVPPRPAPPAAPAGTVTPAPTPPVVSLPRPPGPGNAPFYEVFGHRYFVLPTSHGFRERGMASWYGKPFHGRRTSSGAVFNMYEMTAAHRTLPLPSQVRVTSVDTGRSVLVTVNDRGPFAKDRVIDLSYAAARELGIVQAGTGLVEVEAVTTSSTPAAHMFLQVGAFGERGNAERMQAELAAQGVNNVVIRYDAATDPALYRVRIGPLADPAEFDSLSSRLSAFNIADPQLVTEAPAAGLSLE